MEDGHGVEAGTRPASVGRCGEVGRDQPAIPQFVTPRVDGVSAPEVTPDGEGPADLRAKMVTSVDRPTTVAELIAALQSLSDLDPITRARRTPDLIEAAKTVLSTERSSAMLEAIHAGQRPARIAAALGVSRKTIAARVTPMVIYAFRLRDDDHWVGPHDALADGYEDGELDFQPANRELHYAGLMLVVRYGPLDDPVAAPPWLYAYTTVNGKRMRATRYVQDGLFSA